MAKPEKFFGAGYEAIFNPNANNRQNVRKLKWGHDNQVDNQMDNLVKAALRLLDKA